jgi:hypothetical protein
VEESEMNEETELLILESLEMILLFPEPYALEKQKSILRLKLNQQREKLNEEKKNG